MTAPHATEILVAGVLALVLLFVWIDGRKA